MTEKRESLSNINAIKCEKNEGEKRPMLVYLLWIDFKAMKNMELYRKAQQTFVGKFKLQTCKSSSCHHKAFIIAHSNLQLKHECSNTFIVDLKTEYLNYYWIKLPNCSLLLAVRFYVSNMSINH